MVLLLLITAYAIKHNPRDNQGEEFGVYLCVCVCLSVYYSYVLYVFK